MVGNLASSLDDFDKQALRLGMPFVAHFIGVAALAALETQYATLPQSLVRSEYSQGKAPQGSQEGSPSPASRLEFPGLVADTIQ